MMKEESSPYLICRSRFAESVLYPLSSISAEVMLSADAITNAKHGFHLYYRL